MPQEVRLMVWKEAMPDYGVYPTTFQYEDEQGLILPHDYNVRLTADGSSTITVSLALPPKDARTPAFSARLFTTQALLNTCRESRSEVQFRFPHSIPSAGGVLRFNGARDIIFIMSLHPHLMRPVDHGPSRTVVFAEGWNMLPQRLSVNDDILWATLYALFSSATLRERTASRLYNEVRTFQGFLSNFTNLKQLFWTAPQHISIDAWNNTSQDGRETIVQILGRCYPSGERPGRKFAPKIIRPGLLARSVSYLVGILQGDPEAQENKHLKGHNQPSLPQLRGVEVFPMLSVDPELECFCKAIPLD